MRLYPYGPVRLAIAAGTGYKLYRVVNGQRELLKEQLLSPDEAVENLTGDNADVIKDLFQYAELTADKLASLGMTAEQFRNLAYSTDTLESRPRVAGKQDFLRMKETLITIPADVKQKMPETDRMLSSTIHVMGAQDNEALALASSKTALWKSLSLVTAEPARGINSLGLVPGGDAALSLVKSVLEARQQLSTLSFVNDEFAEEAGFLFRDDISHLNLSDGTAISYVLETPDGFEHTMVVTRGTQNKLSKPQGLLGYGMDGKVPLRWDQPEDPAERSILSGYFIERKLDGEDEFTQLNEEPVVATYTLDETGIYFETPVLHEDTVENGRTAEYRIRSIDIFGRTSEYSDAVSIKVEKVTPPNAPAVEPAVLSDYAEGASQAVSDAISLNGGKRGIVLPVYTDSPDTVRFTVYRAVAVGAGGFGDPQPIADLTYDNPPGDGTVEIKQDVPPTLTRRKLNGAVQFQLANRSSRHPDLIYFDADIKEGQTYKYWVSAWDSWNNESAWSRSVSAAVRTDKEPDVPDSLRITMAARELPDISAEPPGLYYKDVVSLVVLKAMSGLPKRPLPADTDVDIVIDAETQGVDIGTFMTESSVMPRVIDKAVQATCPGTGTCLCS